MEGGTFSGTSGRLAAVDDRIAAMERAGAPLHEVAPLLDEREALRADLAAEKLADVAATINGDLGGQNPGSTAALSEGASQEAAQAAQEALPVSETVERAKAAAVNAEARFRAVAGELQPEDHALMEGALAHVQAKRTAALDLAACMIREGV
jgi:hypothetical protein